MSRSISAPRRAVSSGAVAMSSSPWIETTPGSRRSRSTRRTPGSRQRRRGKSGSTPLCPQLAPVVVCLHDTVRCAPADGRARSEKVPARPGRENVGWRTPCRGSDIAAVSSLAQGRRVHRASGCTHIPGNSAPCCSQCHCARAWHRGTRRVLHPAGFSTGRIRKPGFTGAFARTRRHSGTKWPAQARGVGNARTAHAVSRQGRNDSRKDERPASRTAPRGVRCIGLDPGVEQLELPGRSSSLPWCSLRTKGLE